MNLQPEQPDRSETTGRGTPLSDELRQLEQATSPVARLPVVGIPVSTDSRNPAPDVEAVALRESWLALGHLLEVNTPVVDEAALVSQVRRRVGRQIKRRRWQGAGLALAASLLLVVSVVWLVSRSSGPQSPGNPNAAIAQTPPEQTPPDQLQHVAVEPANTNRAVTNLDDVYWQDDLADDLAQTQQDLVDVQANWARLPDPVAWMQFQMNEFEHELGDSSL